MFSMEVQEETIEVHEKAVKKLQLGFGD